MLILGTFRVGIYKLKTYACLPWRGGHFWKVSGWGSQAIWLLFFRWKNSRHECLNKILEEKTILIVKLADLFGYNFTYYFFNIFLLACFFKKMKYTFCQQKILLEHLKKMLVVFVPRWTLFKILYQRPGYTKCCFNWNL